MTEPIKPLRMVRCDICYGKSFIGGIYPRNGMTRQELIERVRSRGHVNALCQHCGKVATLRMVEDIS